MNCLHCDSKLPDGAMFCGECGRTVAPAAQAPAGPPGPALVSPTAPPAAPLQALPPRAAPPQAAPLQAAPPQAVPGDRTDGIPNGIRPLVPPRDAPSGSPRHPSPEPQPVGPVHPAPTGASVPSAASAPAADDADAADPRCGECGEVLDPHDIFCGSCGSVVRATTRGFGRGGDTAVIEPVRPRTTAPVAPGPAPAASVEPVFIEPAPLEADPAPLAPAPLETAPPPAPPARRDRLFPWSAPRKPASTQPEPSVEQTERAAEQTEQADHDDHEDLELTRIVAPRPGGQRFVLQFSTGESVTVSGSGLIGRNPVPEPEEHVEQLVRVLDPTRSVSKTHLEFGQEAGAFWIRDRYSGNGTLLREPDTSARRCDPGKRYRLVRGSRIDIGEQFFVVS